MLKEIVSTEEVVWASRRRGINEAILELPNLVGDSFWYFSPLAQLFLIFLDLFHLVPFLKVSSVCLSRVIEDEISGFGRIVLRSIAVLANNVM